MKILIIEDDSSLRELMQKALTDDNHIIETAANATTAMMKAEIYDYDCILLDITQSDDAVYRLYEDIFHHVAPAISEIVYNVLGFKRNIHR